MKKSANAKKDSKNTAISIEHMAQINTEATLRPKMIQGTSWSVFRKNLIKGYQLKYK